jgi:peptidoglycan/LPS O-acetylase OafA/YrhL
LTDLDRSTHVVQRERTQTFDSIQVMRGIAALMVVGDHVSQFWGRATGQREIMWRNGAAGVDIFFVISGIVMVLSTHGRPMGLAAAGKFLERRGLRLLPMYWLVTALFTMEYVLIRYYPVIMTHGEDYPHLTGKFLLTSIFLLPFNNAGYYLPVVGVGWTLRFECFFYLAFAASLAFRVKPQYFLSITLLPLAILLQIFKGQHHVNDPPMLLLEFLMGVWMALVVVRTRWQLPRGVLIGVAVVSFSLLLIPWPGSGSRYFTWGIPAFVLLGSLMLLDRNGSVRWPRFLLLLGDASYSLYLIHIFVFCIVTRLLEAAGIVGPEHTGAGVEALMVALCTVSAVAAGIFVYKTVELPLNDALRRRFLRGAVLQVKSAG